MQDKISGVENSNLFSTVTDQQLYGNIYQIVLKLNIFDKILNRISSIINFLGKFTSSDLSSGHKLQSM